MTTLIPSTDNMTLETWSSALIVEFQDLNQWLPEYRGDFQVWAGQLLTVPQFALAELPSPSQYKDWKDWARIVKLRMET